MQLTDVLHAVDAHAEGELTRVVVGGLPPARPAPMAERRLELMADDALRRYLLGEPRGQLCLHAVLIYPPSDPAADVGIVIMESTDYPAMSGSNAICAATVLLETGMVAMSEPETVFTLETPAGLVPVRARCAGGRCERVQFENVPAFVADLDVAVRVPGLGEIVVDVAFGGAFFAVLDGSALGVELVPEQADRISELGRRITAAVAEQYSVTHPERPDFHTVTFTTITGPPRAGGDGRNATVINPGRLDRSPCGTGTSARMAVMHARGELAEGEDFVHESIISTRFTGRIEGVTSVGGRGAIRPSISGRGWVTGTHQIGRDRRDPLGRGFGLADTWHGAAAQWPPPVGELS
ncbi:MAG TPA: proline racemase family protein [Solirubrobacteraceae bacterium]|jgi:proline racemase